MFERYSEKARRVIFFARYECSQLGSSGIEPEHILLGVLREDQSLIDRVFASPLAGFEMRGQIERAAPDREKTSTSVDLPLSQTTERSLAFAVEEAERLHHKHVESGHLLLGLLREETSFAAKLLNEHGLRIPQMRE